jgi:hypothetical protein
VCATTDSEVIAIGDSIKTRSDADMCVLRVHMSEDRNGATLC